MKRILSKTMEVILFMMFLSVVLVIVYKFVDPPVTPLMFIRGAEAILDSKNIETRQQSVALNEISKKLLRSIIASEDSRFFEHFGIDWEAVEDAQKYNARYKGRKVRGASTITMQAARNCFLWQDKNYLRKGLEIYFTYLIEIIWGKKRILEVYANIVEWGRGIYGISEAANKYFNKGQERLTQRQAGLLAAVLPNPRRWSPVKPTGYISRRANTIATRASAIAIPK